MSAREIRNKPHKPVITLLVGLGRIGLGYDLRAAGKTVFTHTGACLAHRGIELIGGVDQDRNRRREFSDFSGLTAYSSINEVPLPPGGIDLVIIATPTSVRKNIILQSLPLKPRIILLEKPIAATFEEGEEIVQLCRKNNVSLFINYFRNFDQALLCLPDFSRKNNFGPPCHAECRYSNGILNNASHFIALLVEWFGLPVTVRGQTKPEKLSSGDFNAVFSLQFSSHTAYFFPLKAEYDIGEIEIFFWKGRLELKNYCETITACELKEDPFYQGYKRLMPTVNLPPQPDSSRYQYIVLDVIVKAMNKPEPITTNVQNALATLKICESIIHEA